MDMLWYGYSELVWFAQWTVISTIIMDLYLVGGDWNHGFWWLSHHIGNSNPNWRTHIFQRVWNHQRLVFVSIFFKENQKNRLPCVFDMFVGYNIQRYWPSSPKMAVLSVAVSQFSWASKMTLTVPMSANHMSARFHCLHSTMRIPERSVYIYIYVYSFYIYIHTVSEMKKSRVIYQKSRVWSII